LKGRGFSRAVSVAKSMAALAAEGSRDPQCDFFRSLFSRADKSFKIVCALAPEVCSLRPL
jgi:hypothetical protein